MTGAAAAADPLSDNPERVPNVPNPTAVNAAEASCPFENS